MTALPRAAEEFLSWLEVERGRSPRTLAAYRRDLASYQEDLEACGGPAIDAATSVDVTAHEVRVGGTLLSLTSREYDLLVFLMQHPRKAFTREQLLNQVWSWTFGDTSTVTVHVRRLREKLESDPTLPRRIVTVWGVGYRYEPEAA